MRLGVNRRGGGLVVKSNASPSIMRARMLRSTVGLSTGYAWVILLVAVSINLVTQMGRNAYAVTGPDLTDSLSLSYAQLGILLTSYSILLMAGAFAFGVLASRYGARFFVAGGAFIGSLAMVVIGFSENFAVAVVASGLLGIASAAATTPVMGMLASWFSPQRRGAAAGLAAAGGGISFIVIGALTPELVNRDPVDGWRHSWWALAAISGLVGLIALAFLREQPGGKSIPKRGLSNWPTEVYKNRLIWTVAAVAFCAGWSIGLYTTFFGVFLEERGIGLDTTGRLFQLIGVLSIISGIVWGYGSDLIGRRMGFLLSFVAFAVGAVIFWQVTALGGFIVSAILVGFTIRAAYTICAACAGDYVPPQFSPAAFGLMGVGAGLGQAIGPYIGGQVADITGDIGWAYVLAIAAAAVGAVISVMLRRPETVPLEAPSPESPAQEKTVLAEHGGTDG